jgi:hypothetical protein
MALPSLKELLHLQLNDLLDYTCDELGKFWQTTRGKYATDNAEAARLALEVRKKRPSVYGGGIFAIIGVVVAAVGLGDLAGHSYMDQILTWVGAIGAVGGGFFVVRDAKDLRGLNFELDRFKSGRDALESLKQRLKDAIRQKKCPTIPW